MCVCECLRLRCALSLSLFKKNHIPTQPILFSTPPPTLAEKLRDKITRVTAKGATIAAVLGLLQHETVLENAVLIVVGIAANCSSKTAQKFGKTGVFDALLKVVVAISRSSSGLGKNEPLLVNALTALTEVMSPEQPFATALRVSGALKFCVEILRDRKQARTIIAAAKLMSRACDKQTNAVFFSSNGGVTSTLVLISSHPHIRHHELLHALLSLLQAVLKHAQVADAFAATGVRALIDAFLIFQQQDLR